MWRPASQVTWGLWEPRSAKTRGPQQALQARGLCRPAPGPGTGLVPSSRGGCGMEQAQSHPEDAHTARLAGTVAMGLHTHLTRAEATAQRGGRFTGGHRAGTPSAS